MMGMRMLQDCGETDASLARRARVIVYRMSLGELVVIRPEDRVSEFVFELLQSPRPHGNALGAFPSVL